MNLKTKLISLGKKNKISVLMFLYKFKYSTIPVLQEYLNVTREGLFLIRKKMEKEGLILSFSYNNGFAKIKIIGITEKGLSLITSYKPHLYQTRAFYPSKFKETQFKHHIGIQQIINDLKYNKLEKYKLNNIEQLKGFDTTFEIRKKRLNEIDNMYIRTQKYPDLLLYVTYKKMMKKIAIELELTPKSIKRYKDIVAHHFNFIRHGFYSKVIYVIPNKIKSIEKNISNFANQKNIGNYIDYVYIC